MIRRGRLFCLVLLIALAGVAAPAQAAEGARPGLGQVWAWLASWLPLPVATDDQCLSIDPNGACRDGGAGSTSDQGPWIDPNGREVPPSGQGLWIDPNG